MLKKVFTWLLAVVLLAGCSAPAAPSVTLTVMAAASLTTPFQQIGAQFEAAHPGVKVAFNFAGSQQLAQQIQNGAGADVFASASQKYMDQMTTGGQVEKDAVRVFARNRLVIIFPKANPANVVELKDLSRAGLKLVLAAKEVPVGQYALEFLKKADASLGAGYQAAVLKNVVSYEDNVKAVLSKVTLGEADAGIVYSSDLTGESAQKAGQLVIPDELNVIASYPISALKASKQPDLAQQFVDFVLSAEGQKALAASGFLPPAK